MKSFIKYLAILLSVIILGSFAFLIYGVPAILNSQTAGQKYEQFLSDKTGVDVHIDGFHFNWNKNLSFSIKLKQIIAKDNKASVVNIKNIDYTAKRFSIKPDKVNINSIYLDFEKLKPRLSNNGKKSGESLNVDYLPIINVKKAYIRFDKNSSMQFYKIHSEKIDGTVFCAFTGILTIPYSKEPIIIGEDGYLYFDKNVNFEDFTLRYKTSKLNLSGAISNLNFNGKNLSVYDLEKFFVFFYKTKHPDKRNFIENFDNFKGTLDVDLTLTLNGLKGKCRAHNLGADFSKFKIPVELPAVDFYFKGRQMKAAANGSFGGEKVYTDVVVSALATKHVIARGNVRSKLSNNFTRKYYNTVGIKGIADASVKYLTKDKKVNIEYGLDIPAGTDISYKNGSLGNTGFNRKITAHTLKDGTNLYLKDYDYSFINAGKKQVMLLGDGLFVQKQGHMKPVYISLRTNKKVPVTLVQSFVDDYIDGGTFSADVKYEFANKDINGKLSIFDTSHKDFMYVKQADIETLGDKLKVNIDGKFFNSPIVMKLIAANRIEKEILIDTIDISLDKFYVKRGDLTTVKSSFKHQNKAAKKDLNVTVKNGKIKVGEVIHPKVYLQNVEIYGSLRDNIADVTIPGTKYAGGILSGKGKYNIKKHSSDINFLASDIDSNEVATKVFNLPNQFEGTGYATLHMKTKNKLNSIHAHATFAITDGFLPKLGSREIIVNASNRKKKSPLSFIKKSFKFTLSKISNIDFSKPNVFYSNLRGTFILDNSCVHNVKIFSQSDYLSLFVEGNYNISTSVGDLTIWGRHNKVAEKKIKIFKIPLSWIYKLFFRVERSGDENSEKINQIPPVKSNSQSEIGIFRVKANGNLNTDDINVQLKDIRH